MVLLDTDTSGTSREIYSEDAEGEMRSQPQLRNDKYIMMLEHVRYEPFS